MKILLLLLALPVLVFLWIMALWIMFLAVMNLQRARDAGTLTVWGYRLGMPVLYLGLFMDCMTNVFVCTFLFLQFPRRGEYLVTQRLERNIQDPSGFRLRMALWFCANMLDTFDPSGCHCKK